MHYLDKASPVLLQRCATGEHIKEATITVRKAGSKEPLEYLIIKLTDILVSNVSSSGTGDASTSESVTLNYAKIVVEYKPQKADGSLDAGRHFQVRPQGEQSRLAGTRCSHEPSLGRASGAPELDPPRKLANMTHGSAR